MMLVAGFFDELGILKVVDGAMPKLATTSFSIIWAKIISKKFRFLKDKSFKVAELDLKKDENIESICDYGSFSIDYSIEEWMLDEDRSEYVESALKTDSDA